MNTSKYNWRSTISYSLFDVGNSAVGAIHSTFIFAVYFATTVYPENGTALWGYMTAAAAVFVAVLVSFISNVLGVVLGAMAAYFGKVVDDIIMRVADITFAFPDLLLAAFISSSARRPVIDFADKVREATGWQVLENTVFIDYTMVFGALAIVSLAGVARLIRGKVLSLREQDFIRAEVALGATGWRIIRKHLIPNSIAPVIVSISAGFGGVMLLESSLSFLGLGIQPPGASWGNMVSSNMDKWRAYPLLVAIPGVVLAIAVFGFNFFILDMTQG